MRIRYSLKLEHRDGAGDLVHSLDWISSRPWHNEDPCSDHALVIAEQFWKPSEGDSLNVLQKKLDGEDQYSQVDGLDC
jgi:hypothetical protein